MSRRIEVELTSIRPDGTWTWRAAGAREPKGVLDGNLLPPGAAVGDVLRADIEFDLDGMVVVGVAAPKAERSDRHEALELLGSRQPDSPGVTVERSHGARPKRSSGKARSRGSRQERSGHEPPAPRNPPPERPRAPRLRPGRRHRRAMLESLPEEQRPLAELVLKQGIPAVRQVIGRQHDQARPTGEPLLRPEPLLALAEQLLPRLRSAEWKDRAEAAVASIETVDLRDLRSVVSAAEVSARDDEARELGQKLREGLASRVEKEHSAWLAELAATLEEGRIVRALRLSSRPPKAGAPLPPALASRLAEQATASLTSDISQGRFALLLEAIAFSPVHRRVAATSIPEKPSAQLRDAVSRFADRVPGVAAQFTKALSTGDAPTGSRQRSRGVTAEVRSPRPR